MKKSSRKETPSKDGDFVHSQLGSLSKLIKTFRSRANAARFGHNLMKECQPDAETRAFLVRLLDAEAKDAVGKGTFATSDLYLPILQFLLKDDFTKDEAPYLQQLIYNYESTRHISDPFDDVIDVLFSLPDARLMKFFETLLTHDMISLRESALDLLEVLWKRNRLQSWIVGRVAQYKFDHPDLNRLETDYLDILTRLFEVKASATKEGPKR